MLELLLCSLVTILPDYLYRRYRQGKRFGKEITLYSVWYELRWGITTCLMLTVCLITLIFYFHPSTNSVTLYFRTVPILPETSGRVAAVYVESSSPVKQGSPIFKLDSSKQEAALETAQRKISEIDANMVAAKADVAKVEAQIREGQSSYQQAVDELQTKQELQRRNSGTVPEREIERLQLLVQGRRASLDATVAAKEAEESQVANELPAARASSEAALAQAQVDLDKTVIRAGVDGRVEQFVLKVGDVVNPLMRPAGVLVPDEAGRSMVAGFDQIEAQVIRPGMIAEVACVSKPFAIVPMVVTRVQDFIAAGQFRGGDQLIDPQQVTRAGTLLAFLEPLYDGGIDDVTPGSSCVANAYTGNHDVIAAPETGTLKGLALHAVDGLGLVHALLLRIQALVLPFRTLVFSGH